MFPGEKEGEYEPYKVRRKDNAATKSGAQQATNGATENAKREDEVTFEEDMVSEDGAVWPIVAGKIVDWPAFYALLTHVYNTVNGAFHTPVLLIAQPVWTSKELERITQFMFEKFKIPAMGVMDSALATTYAYGLHTATVVDVGYEKADVTAVSEYLIHEAGRALAVPDCGGEAMTQRLLKLLGSKGFSREMCEQLKKSSICEVLPKDADLPAAEKEEPKNPAAVASTGMDGQGNTVGPPGANPQEPANGENGTEQKDGEGEDEGVIDIASIVTGGKMEEYLAQKEKEKAEKAAAKKKGLDTAASSAKPVRIPNSKRYKNTFSYEDYALHNALKDANVSGKRMAEMQEAMGDGPNKRQKTPEADGDQDHSMTDATTTNGDSSAGFRRELEVGLERFQAASGGILYTLADAIHRTISSVEEVNKRSELWDSLIIVGNGSKVRGFKEALLTTLHAKYLISPSSATIFTSELPSNFSTPMATGANTPQPQSQMQPHMGGHVNPLLVAATTAQNPHLNPMNAQGLPGQFPGQLSQHNTHSSHAQTPTSIKLAKMPEYFPEWKEAGYEEAVFLGAQVAARVLYTVDQGLSKGYMTRTDYNEQGPQGIHDYKL